jgi:hypothetical protein
VHVFAQLAQFVFVPSAVSQPAKAVQSAKPAAQLVTVQLPLTHDSLAPGRLQIAPQAPQFSKLVRLVSQPLSGFPSQLPKPAAHVGLQS